MSHRDTVPSVLISESAIRERIADLARRIEEDYRDTELTILTVLNGAIILTSDLMRLLDIPVRFDWISVASYHGGTASTGSITFDRVSTPDLADRHVLIIDDILDTGLTLAAIRTRIAESRPASIRSCVLLRKRKKRLAEVDADYAGFDIDDRFVVGYGLDFDGRYRNLPFIGVLKQ